MCDRARPHIAVEAAYLRGLYLCALGRVKEGVAVFDDLIERCRDESEPVVGDRVADALFFKAGYLAQGDDPEQALAIFDEVVARFGDAVSQGQRAAVARSLRTQGSLLVSWAATTLRWRPGRS
jgi:hypothetical protein